MSEEQKNPPFLLRETYLAMIRDSVGTAMFSKWFYEVHGEPKDVLDNGDLACAVVVSSIEFLTSESLIKERHTKVSETIRDMVESGWYVIPKPCIGCVIHWDRNFNDPNSQKKTRHIGFYLDENTAVSNDSKERVVIIHHPTYGFLENGEPFRKVLAYYWHDNLGPQIFA